jgi:DNA polymerase-3 subunit epsilon
MSQFDWLVAAFPNTAFTVFDTETTGLDPKLNRVVEIGGIRFDAKGIAARFNVLINPGVSMPSEVTKINGITDDMLRGQPASSVVLPDFLRFIGDSVLIAHNAPFDISFINEELARIGLPLLKNRVIDTRIFAKETFPNLPKYALQELAVRFSIDVKDAHRAEDDARVCMELFLICLKELTAKNPALAGGQAITTTTEQPVATTGPVQAQKPEEKEQDDLFAEDMEEEEEFIDETEL